MAVTDLLTPTGLFYYLLVPTVILWYAYFRYSRRRLYELAAKIPGPEGLPLVGSAHEFLGSASRKSFASFAYAACSASSKIP